MGFIIIINTFFHYLAQLHFQSWVAWKEGAMIFTKRWAIGVATGSPWLSFGKVGFLKTPFWGNEMINKTAIVAGNFEGFPSKIVHEVWVGVIY